MIKKIILLVIAFAITTVGNSQNYWNSYYKTVSTLTLSDCKITLEKKDKH